MAVDASCQISHNRKLAACPRCAATPRGDCMAKRLRPCKNCEALRSVRRLADKNLSDGVTVAHGQTDRPLGGPSRAPARKMPLKSSTHSVVFQLGVALLAVAGAGTVMAAFGRHAWVAELASHFPVHYLATAVLVGAVALLRRHYGIAIAAAALGVPNAWRTAPYVMPAIVPPSVAESRAGGASVVALNLFYKNPHHAAVREYLSQVDAEVLVLSELTPEWVDELTPITSRYPYWLALPQRTPWGLGVFSRYPLRDGRVVDLGVPGSVNVQAVLDMPGRPVELLAVHLSSPTSPQRAEIRNHQLGVLAEIFGRRTAGSAVLPRMLVGDLNVTPFSPYFRDLLEATGLEDAARPFGVSGTWPSWLPRAQITIDHCLTDRQLDVAEVRRGPNVGSDHYPLEIQLAPG